MTSFEIYCESCKVDSSVQTELQPKFCPACGVEIDDGNIAEEEYWKEWDESDLENPLKDIDDWRA